MQAHVRKNPEISFGAKHNEQQKQRRIQDSNLLSLIGGFAALRDGQRLCAPTARLTNYPLQPSRPILQIAGAGIEPATYRL